MEINAIQCRAVRVRGDGIARDVMIGTDSGVSVADTEDVVGLLLGDGEEIQPHLLPSTSGYSRSLVWKADSGEKRAARAVDFTGVCILADYLSDLALGPRVNMDVVNSFYSAMVVRPCVNCEQGPKRHKCADVSIFKNAKNPWQTAEFFYRVDEHLSEEPLVDFGAGFLIPDMLKMGPAEYLRSVVVDEDLRNKMHLPYQSLAWLRLYEPVEHQALNDSVDTTIALMPLEEIYKLSVPAGSTSNSLVDMPSALVSCSRMQWDPVDILNLYTNGSKFRAAALAAGVPGRWMCADCGLRGSLRSMLFHHSLFHQGAFVLTCMCRRLQGVTVCPGEFTVAPPTEGIGRLYAHQQVVCDFFTETNCGHIGGPS